MSTSEHLLVRQAYRRIPLLQYSPTQTDDERKCYVPTRGFPARLHKAMRSMGWTRGFLLHPKSGKQIVCYFHHLTVWDEPPTPLTNACPYPNVVPRQPPDFVVGHPAVRLLRRRPASWATDVWFLEGAFEQSLPNAGEVGMVLTRLGWVKSSRQAPGGGRLEGRFKPVVPSREQVPLNIEHLAVFQRKTTKPRGVSCPKPERYYCEYYAD